jgi:hypothetical protein
LVDSAGCFCACCICFIDADAASVALRASAAIFSAATIAVLTIAGMAGSCVPLLLSGVKTVYKSDGSITDESHPAFRPHLMQGWTPDFVPSMVEDATQVL